MLERLTALIPVLTALCSSAVCADYAYVGAEVCGTCHPAQFAGQSASGHALAFQKATEHTLAASFTPSAPLQRPPQLPFSICAHAARNSGRADDSKILTRLPVDWAFGAGAHAVTFVGKASDQLYVEHSFNLLLITRNHNPST